MKRILPVATAIALVAATGIVHGRLTGRWSRPVAVEAAVARLDRVPMAFGDWQGMALELEPGVADRAGIAGYAMRRYEDRRTGQSVTILLVCGRPGPISVHTPDICYAGAGYEPMGEQQKEAIGTGAAGPSAEFERAVFAKPTSAVPDVLQISWSWFADGSWRAPDNPRLTFAPAPALYKLYIVRPMASADDRAGDETARSFARELLPRLEKALAAGPR